MLSKVKSAAYKIQDELKTTLKCICMYTYIQLLCIVCDFFTNTQSREFDVKWGRKFISVIFMASTQKSCFDLFWKPTFEGGGA
jgi:hypothetical protein